MIKSGEDAVLGNDIVECMRLIAMEMTEGSSLSHACNQRPPRVPIIDSVQWTSFKKSLHIMLHHWDLSSCSVDIASGFDICAISKREDILKASMLQRERIHRD